MSCLLGHVSCLEWSGTVDVGMLWRRGRPPNWAPAIESIPDTFFGNQSGRPNPSSKCVRASGPDSNAGKFNFRVVTVSSVPHRRALPAGPGTSTLPRCCVCFVFLAVHGHCVAVHRWPGGTYEPRGWSRGHRYPNWYRRGHDPEASLFIVVAGRRSSANCRLL